MATFHATEEAVREAIRAGEPVWLQIDTKLGDYQGTIRPLLEAQQKATREPELSENLARPDSVKYKDHLVVKSPDPDRDWADATTLDPCIVVVFDAPPKVLVRDSDWQRPEEDG